MRLLYIDSSFFLETQKSRAMLVRLIKHLQGNEPDILMISITPTLSGNESFLKFMDLMERLDIHMVISPMHFKFGYVAGEIDDFCAYISGIQLKPREGSLYEIIAENDEIDIQRIYLDVLYEEKRAVKLFSEKDLEDFLKKYLVAPINPKKFS